MEAFSAVGRDVDTQGTSADADTYIAALGMRPLDPPSGAMAADWLTCCYRLTPRVEPVSPSLALLDLGRCAPEEALGAVQPLLARLGKHARVVRLGVAPGLALAQLALRQTSASEPVRLVTAAEAAAFLRPLPVAVLIHLHPKGIVTAETLRQLAQYGLRTLGQLARLGGPALRKQFGASVGGYLAAVASGQDPRPLLPTPPPATLTLRLRLPEGALPPAEIPGLVPLFAAQAVTLLHQGRVQAQGLRLSVRWESGGTSEMSVVLPQPTQELAPLTRAVQELLRHLLDARQARAADGPVPAIAGLRLTLGELHPVTPEQGAFWQSRTQRLAALAEVAETLAVRYGRAVVRRPRLAVPEAIYHEDRYRLHDLVTEVAGDAAEGPAKARQERKERPAAAPSRQRVSTPEIPHRVHWW
jgi:hypothetical protein